MKPERTYTVVAIRAGEMLLTKGKAIVRVCDPRLLEPPKRKSWDELERELSYSQRLFLNRFEPTDLAFDIPIDYAILLELDLRIGDSVSFEIQKTKDLQQEKLPN